MSPLPTHKRSLPGYQHAPPECDVCFDRRTYIIVSQSLRWILGFALGVVHAVSLDKCVMIMMASCRAVSVPSKPSALCYSSLSLPSSGFLAFPFPECCIVGVLWFAAFSVWLLSLGNMFRVFLVPAMGPMLVYPPIHSPI